MKQQQADTGPIKANGKDVFMGAEQPLFEGAGAFEEDRPLSSNLGPVPAWVTEVNSILGRRNGSNAKPSELDAHHIMQL